MLLVLIISIHAHIFYYDSETEVIDVVIKMRERDGRYKQLLNLDETAPTPTDDADHATNHMFVYNKEYALVYNITFCNLSFPFFSYRQRYAFSDIPSVFFHFIGSKKFNGEKVILDSKPDMGDDTVGADT